MIRKIVAAAATIAALSSAAWSEPARGPIYRTIPQGCQVRPVDSCGQAGPMYDNRGFYQGYYQPMQIQPTYTPMPGYPTTIPQTGPTNSYATGTVGGFYGGYAPPVMYNPGQYNNMGAWNASPACGISGYSPTLPFVNTNTPAVAQPIGGGYYYPPVVHYTPHCR